MEQFLTLSRNDTKRPLPVFKGKAYKSDRLRNRQEVILWMLMGEADGINETKKHTLKLTRITENFTGMIVGVNATLPFGLQFSIISHLCK